MSILYNSCMLNTVNISIPKNLHNDAKKLIANRGYSSLSELIRDALRRMLYQPLTENGFAQSFENEVLLSSASPKSKDEVWKTEEDIKKYFDNLRKATKNVDN